MHASPTINYITATIGVIAWSNYSFKESDRPLWSNSSLALPYGVQITHQLWYWRYTPLLPSRVHASLRVSVQHVGPCKQKITVTSYSNLNLERPMAFNKQYCPLKLWLNLLRLWHGVIRRYVIIWFCQIMARISRNISFYPYRFGK